MNKYVVCFILVTCIYFAGAGQNSYGGYPFGLLQPELLRVDKTNTASMVVKAFTSKEKEKLFAIHQGSSLFAFPATAVSGKNMEGTWTQIEGHQVWHLPIRTENPEGTYLRLANFNLPHKAKLFFFDKSGNQIRGAYTFQNNNESKTFLTGVVIGEELILEYSVPVGEKRSLPFIIEEIYSSNSSVLGVDGEVSSMVDTGFMASFPCQVNVNCPEGADLQIQKRGVVRIMMVLAEGLGWCSGSLMNNTREDFTPYILSAFHCQYKYTPYYNLWRFDFNFESSACDVPMAAPDFSSLQGCESIAEREETDFLLLKLNQQVPSSNRPYYNGWDANSETISFPAKLIHHPTGDIKKVSVENSVLFLFQSTVTWDDGIISPPNTHLRCDMDIGGHQPGSSGGPLFDQSGLVLGQLHGGTTKEDCVQSRAYFGSLRISWEGGSKPSENLKDWLDPDDTGITQLVGTEGPVSNRISLNGRLISNGGRFIPNVEINANGQSSSQTVYTDASGTFTLSDLAVDDQVVLSFEKNDHPNLGISALDLVQIRNHILGLTIFTEETSILAADANNSQTVSASDMIQIQNVLLGNWSEFPNRNSWGFLPSQYVITAGDSGVQLLITGYKIGDVNGSAVPSN